MVNKESSRYRLLSLLQNTGEALSGELLSRELGISRVAVWKQIGRLEEAGYEIESSRKGYLLRSEPADPLEAHLFAGREQFYCLEETESTMDDAREILRRRGPEGDFVVTAEKQNAGRGRNSREWLSPRGGLFFTHSFAAALPCPLSYHATMAALVSLTEILREDYKQPARIKWPNDILVEEKKIVGLLAAFSGEGERISRMNLGIGINVNNAPPLPGTTCSLSSLTGKKLSRSYLMKGYLERMNRYTGETGESLTARFNRLCPAGNSLGIELANGSRIKGKAEGVDRWGALCLKDGRRIYPGECQKTESKITI
ncbi:MAG: biotin--[acetyl-CoA-carboxylase] ligase [Spirochaetales bacterium]|nr:biotin--[acetyl-CoA-carboxylase] ligase [Spirochaetales bacterium]